MKVMLCTPTLTQPHPALLSSIEATVPLLDAAGVEHGVIYEIGCPYISHARATMLRKALDAGADTIVFLDHDLSWRPDDLLKLIETEDPVVAGLYRYKLDNEEYMGSIKTQPDHRPVVRADGCIAGFRVPAGFLKVTRDAVRSFMRAYPELVYGHAENPSVDLFNHGAHDGVWYGEDMAFSRRWIDCGGEIWVQPDLSLTHHDGDKAYPGNFHEFMLRQPGGIKHEVA